MKDKNKFGLLDKKYHFALNPYPDLRSTTCPDCGSKTGQRKLPLVILVAEGQPLSLNYTNKHCKNCDKLIGHKHEIEHFLTQAFQERPEIIGNEYFIVGTMDKKAWQENIKGAKPISEMWKYIHDFLSYEEIRMTIGGWFPAEKKPPVRVPPRSEEWVKH